MNAKPGGDTVIIKFRIPVSTDRRASCPCMVINEITQTCWEDAGSAILEIIAGVERIVIRRITEDTQVVNERRLGGLGSCLYECRNRHCRDDADNKHGDHDFYECKSAVVFV